MNVYVASNYDNVEQVRRVSAMLVSNGCSLSYDWTNHAATLSGLVGPARDAKVREIAKLQREAIFSCGALVFLNHPSACGSVAELGMAIAWRKPTIALGATNENCPRCIYMALPEIMHARDEAHLLELVQYAATFRPYSSHTLVTYDTVYRQSESVGKG